MVRLFTIASILAAGCAAADGTCFNYLHSPFATGMQSDITFVSNKAALESDAVTTRCASSYRAGEHRMPKVPDSATKFATGERPTIATEPARKGGKGLPYAPLHSARARD